ncbi:probable WRKY transcription factor protein 1 [Condylostylus longicornis]|uniref:probable WRKY transcription factor protein 1 n=1 Tax=Condylostylus longicornis TaxID=2530218 RepID=UPI00244DAE4B|nr:probable WRKY transcription factor protein 1 [Condylostylus longicornis]
MAWQTIKKTFNNYEYQARAKRQCKRKLNYKTKNYEKFSKVQLNLNQSCDNKNYRNLSAEHLLYRKDFETNEDVENILADICTNTDFNLTAKSFKSKNDEVNKKFFHKPHNLIKENYWFKPYLLKNSKNPTQKLNQLIIEENTSSDEENINQMASLIKTGNYENSPNCISTYTKSFKHKQLLHARKNNSYNSNTLGNNIIHVTSDDSDSTKSDNEVSDQIILESSGNSNEEYSRKELVGQKSLTQNDSSYIEENNIDLQICTFEKQQQQGRETPCSEHSQLFSKIEIDYISSATESSTGNYTKIVSQTSVENEHKESDGEKELELLIRDLQSYHKDKILAKRIKPKKGGYVEKLRSVLRSDRSNYYFWRNELENSRVERGLIGEVVEVTEIFKQTLLKIASQNECFFILLDLNNKIYKGQNFCVGTKIIYDINSEPYICNNVKFYIGVSKVIRCE